MFKNFLPTANDVMRNLHSNTDDDIPWKLTNNNYFDSRNSSITPERLPPTKPAKDAVEALSMGHWYGDTIFSKNNILIPAIRPHQNVFHLQPRQQKTPYSSLYGSLYTVIQYISLVIPNSSTIIFWSRNSSIPPERPQPSTKTSKDAMCNLRSNRWYSINNFDSRNSSTP